MAGCVLVKLKCKYMNSFTLFIHLFLCLLLEKWVLPTSSNVQINTLDCTFQTDKNDSCFWPLASESLEILLVSLAMINARGMKGDH